MKNIQRICIDKQKRVSHILSYEAKTNGQKYHDTIVGDEDSWTYGDYDAITDILADLRKKNKICV